MQFHNFYYTAAKKAKQDQNDNALIDKKSHKKEAIETNIFYRHPLTQAIIL